MRLILAAALLTALTLPAQAQRLDTRVRELGTTPTGLTCRGNANRGLILDHDRDGRNPRAILFATPVEKDKELDVQLGIVLTPSAGSKHHGAAGRSMGLQMWAIDRKFPIEVTGGRLLIDGQNSGVRLMLQTNPDRPDAFYLTIPDADRADVTDRMLSARWVDFEALNQGVVVRRFRFDMLRVADVTETLSLIKWSCLGDKAD
ncbi:MAG: hypothetical protein ACAH11_02310 [Sphingomonas sp.]